MNRSREIRIRDRARGVDGVELVLGGGMLRFLYGNAAGRFLAGRIFSLPVVSRLTGAFWSSSLSRGRIAPFVERYGIAMEQFEDASYRSFNDFFVRRFRPGARTFCDEPNRMPAFAEARYLAWERIGPDSSFPVKGARLDAATALGSAERARPFAAGPLLIARLCPVDYHRYHYPADGTTGEAYTLPGRLHSVNPFALERTEGVLAGNRRRVSLLECARFGRLAFVAVGAMGVGRIVQTHDESRPHRRGQEKGYFRFGGSTVLLFGEPGRWRPDADLLENTAAGIETLVRLGEGIATVE